MPSASTALFERIATAHRMLIASILVCTCVCTCAVAGGVKESTLEQLKARLASAPESERPRLCVEIAERQLASATKLFADGESEKAKAALSDVATFAESARDAEVQSHKRLKQTEITVRKMTHKLADLKHMVTHDEQAAVQNTIDRLQRVRDDLLTTMFPKGEK
ncbi:MAG TPA: hypothetical protein VI386_11700 [Candidatus Sulfotelmatobacter sp.]